MANEHSSIPVTPALAETPARANTASRYSMPFLFLLAFVAGALGASVWFSPDTLPTIQLCQFKALTQLPCPGCGLTRSWCAISHGQFGDAWQFNPFGFVFYGLALTTLLWPIADRFFPRVCVRLRGSRLVLWAPAVLAVSMFVFGLARILSGSKI